MSEKNKDAFGWGDDLPPPSMFTKLDEGDYKFEVKSLTKARGEVKNLGCTVDIARVTILVVPFGDTEADPVERDIELPLHRKYAWKHYQFFAAIGQYTHGDVEAGKAFRPNWAKIEGRAGWLNVTHKPGKQEGKTFEEINFLDENGRTRASDPERKVGKKSRFED